LALLLAITSHDDDNLFLFPISKEREIRQDDGSESHEGIFSFPHRPDSFGVHSASCSMDIEAVLGGKAAGA
jgi:hypothetical protein